MSYMNINWQVGKLANLWQRMVPFIKSTLCYIYQDIFEVSIIFDSIIVYVVSLFILFSS